MIGSVLAAALTMGFVAPAHASFNDQFVCEALGDVEAIVIISSEDSRNASVQFTSSADSGAGETSTVAMRQVLSASGVRYEGENVSFHAKGNEGLLTDDMLTTRCRFAGEMPQPDDITAIRADMVGRWAGKLEYRDYQSDQWFPLPVAVTITALPDPVTYLTLAAYDDGAGGIVRTSTLTMLANAGDTEYYTQYRTGREPVSYTNSLQVVTASDSSHWTIVATRKGMDDNRPAIIKETSVRDGDTITTLKEVHFVDNPDADDWLVRNRVTLTYAGPAEDMAE
ncbi:MAG: MliC family protein [Pseudomonadota bacterium]